MISMAFSLKNLGGQNAAQQCWKIVSSILTRLAARRLRHSATRVMSGQTHFQQSGLDCELRSHVQGLAYKMARIASICYRGG